MYWTTPATPEDIATIIPDPWSNYIMFQVYTRRLEYHRKRSEDLREGDARRNLVRADFLGGCVSFMGLENLGMWDDEQRVVRGRLVLGKLQTGLNTFGG
jgi:hypothetical protein